MSYQVLVNSNTEMEKGKLPGYLQEMGITETGKMDGFTDYRVASGLTRDEASTRLCDVAGDMLMVFDCDPTPVNPRGNTRLEFANQLGIFYIDQIPSL